jgi:inhibitor of KinA sporulation pathway (predicted exonuclease)
MPKRGSVRYLNVVDVESTCWEREPPEGQHSDIIEIGISRVDIEEARIIRSTGVLVRPESSEIGDFCTKLTTLTPEMVKQEGIPFSEACDWLRHTFGSHKTPWASWGDYDRIQFQRCCDRYLVRYPFGRTHLNIKHLFSVMRGNRFTTGMRHALKEAGLPLTGVHHRGADDARNIAELFLHIRDPPREDYGNAVRLFSRERGN